MKGNRIPDPGVSDDRDDHHGGKAHTIALADTKGAFSTVAKVHQARAPVKTCPPGVYALTITI
jgi:hypothetical protein